MTVTSGTMIVTGEGPADGDSWVHGERRFRVAPDMLVSGTLIAAGEAAEPQSIACALVEISSHACRVQTHTPWLSAPSQVILRIQHGQHGVGIEAAARIRWTRQIQVGQTSYGLRFRRSLPEDILHAMITRALITRRERRRYSVRVPVRFRRQGAAGEHRGLMIDLSEGGLRFCTDQPLHAGERLLLLTDEGLEVQVRTVWSLESRTEYRIGCAFLRVGAFQSLKSYVPPRLASATGD